MPQDILPPDPDEAKSVSSADFSDSDHTKKSKRRFRLLIIVIILLYAILHTYKATIEYQNARQDDLDIFQESLDTYRDQVQLSLDRRRSQTDVDVSTLGLKGANGAITSNFEGPKINIHAMEFEGELIDLNSHPGVEDYSVTSLLFDPDHAKLGLPNLDVKVSPIRPFKQENEDGRLKRILGKAVNILPGRSKSEGPRPYKIYKKQVPYDSVLKTVAMQLWLMEFHITTSISSDEIKDKVKKAFEKEDKAQQKDDAEFLQIKLDSLQEAVDLRREKRETSEKFRKDRKKEREKRFRKRSGNEEDIRKVHEKLAKRPKAKRWLKKKETLLELARLDSISLAKDMLEIAMDEVQAQADRESEVADKNILLTFKRDLRTQPGKQFPSEWYGGSQPVSVQKLKKESDPLGAKYDDLKIWFKVEPHAAPWYIQSETGKNLEPIMAVGAIYCTEVQNTFEKAPEYSIGSNTSKGIAMGLYETPQFKTAQVGKLMDGSQKMPSDYEVLDSDVAEGSIWNKPYYIKVFLKNIGVKKSQNKLIGGKRYHDQVTYSFLMPLFVRGSWDVMPPDEVIPDWDPPRPKTVDGFQLSWLVPGWGLPKPFGGILSTLLLIIVIGCVLVFFFPALLPVFTNIFSKIVGGINKGFSGIAKKIGGKKKNTDDTV